MSVGIKVEKQVNSSVCDLIKILRPRSEERYHGEYDLFTQDILNTTETLLEIDDRDERL
jgi:hypothetical protein